MNDDFSQEAEEKGLEGGCREKNGCCVVKNILKQKNESKQTTTTREVKNKAV
ncbi:MAG: hypothetical protein L6275_04050 [Candidatus Portnoybacteria bacterium]|nr:hypothetical protein [Candidatus Portnoybacteria bacterium]